MVNQPDPLLESFTDASFRFGPSLPHDSILTVLRFFGMPELWVTFMEKWLKASLSFDHGAPPKTRQRGVPIAHTLSVSDLSTKLHISYRSRPRWQSGPLW